MRIAVFAPLLLGLAFPACAQIDNGNITGRITDPTGAAIVGAQVTVTQTEMNFETVATTNQEGTYRVLDLRPGPYRLVVVASGFKKFVSDSIELRVNGGVVLLKWPALRSDWQDLGGDRFNEGNQNSMIDCGPTILNYGNSCFTYVQPFGLGKQRRQCLEQPETHCSQSGLSQGRPAGGAVALCTSAWTSRTPSLGRAQHKPERPERCQRSAFREDQS